jgi:hypothetical protein
LGKVVGLAQPFLKVVGLAQPFLKVVGLAQPFLKVVLYNNGRFGFKFRKL